MAGRSGTVSGGDAWQVGRSEEIYQKHDEHDDRKIIHIYIYIYILKIGHVSTLD